MPGGNGVVKVSWPREDRARAKETKGTLFAIAVDDGAYVMCSGGVLPKEKSVLCWQTFRFWQEIQQGKTPQEAFKEVFEKKKDEKKPDDKNSGPNPLPPRKTRSK